MNRVISFGLIFSRGSVLIVFRFPTRITRLTDIIAKPRIVIVEIAFPGYLNDGISHEIPRPWRKGFREIFQHFRRVHVVVECYRGEETTKALDDEKSKAVHVRKLFFECA